MRIGNQFYSNTQPSMTNQGRFGANPWMIMEMMMGLMVSMLSQMMRGQGAGGFSPFQNPNFGGGSAGGGAPSIGNFLGGHGGGGSSPSAPSAPSSPSAPVNSSVPAYSGKSGPIKNETDFAHSLLQALGAPETAANIQSLVNWEKREGGQWHNSAHFNPLNTTQSAPGATGMNSVGVKAYTSWEQGIKATVDTLHNGKYNDLVAALKSGKGLSHGSYKGLSTWSGGGYSSI